MVIVFGASGFVGRAVLARLREDGLQALGTCRSRPGPGLVPFDFADLGPGLARLPHDGVTHAVFCTSSVRSLDEALIDGARARQADVLGPIEAMRRLLAEGTVPVFLSSDHVFGGGRGMYREDDAPDPCSAYGRHKAEVERFLLGQARPDLVLRFGKVFGVTPGDGTILTDCAERLRRGETLRLAADQRFSPVSVDDLAAAIALAVRRGLTGLWHLAGPEAFSRHELGALVKRELGLPAGQVEACSIGDFAFTDARPRDTSLDGARFRRETGFRYRPVTDCVRAIGSGVTRGGAA